MIDYAHSINSTPGIIAIKNPDLKYIRVTEQLAQVLGWNSVENCVGKTDYDIPCEASKFADLYRVQDNKVITSKMTLVTLDIQHYKIGWKTLLTNRTPLLNQDESCGGIVTHCVDISDTVVSRYYNGLFQLDRKMFGMSHKKAASYILNSDYCSLPLTKKQETCLFFLIRGKTIKQIAITLGISPRTVEDHVSAIKNKLNCQTKQDVIEKAIDSGFLYYFPANLNLNYAT